MQSESSSGADHPAGAILFPGGIAVLETVLFQHAPRGRHVERVAACCASLQSDPSVRAIQCLLSPGERPWEGILAEQGFVSVADLGYMACQVAAHTRAGRSGGTWSTSDRDLRGSAVPAFEPYRPADTDRLAQVVEATYVGSQDCPQLPAARTAGEVLAGYRAIGASEDRLWWFLREGAADAGCLLLADHPATDQVELVYVGIVPAFRGRGWGAAATRFALDQAATRQRPRLVLSVDLANRPALAIYESLGFTCFDTRRVMFWQRRTTTAEGLDERAAEARNRHARFSP